MLRVSVRQTVRTIEIGLPWAEIERRHERVQAAYRFKYLDRVPVVPGIYPRYWLHKLGHTWADPPGFGPILFAMRQTSGVSKRSALPTTGIPTPSTCGWLRWSCTLATTSFATLTALCGLWQKDLTFPEAP
jgi:hypothetical protein